MLTLEAQISMSITASYCGNTTKRRLSTAISHSVQLNPNDIPRQMASNIVDRNSATTRHHQLMSSLAHIHPLIIRDLVSRRLGFPSAPEINARYNG